MQNRAPLQRLAQSETLLVLQTTTGLTTDTDITTTPNTPSYEAFNLGLHVGDDAAAVRARRMQLLSTLNQNISRHDTNAQPITKIQWLSQVHGDTIYDADAAPSLQAPAADAMISSRTGQALAIMTADCVPVTLYQPTTGKIAAIHAGWQGLANGIIAKTVAQFDSTAPISAWIGACINQDNYEVGMAVAHKLYAGCQAAHSIPDMSEADFIHRYSDAKTMDTDKCHINLPQLAFDQVTHAGARVQHPMPVACSYANADYYSYRRQTHLGQPATGRMAMIIVRLA